MRSSRLILSCFGLSFLLACSGSVETSSNSSAATSSGSTTGSGAGGSATTTGTGGTTTTTTGTGSATTTSASSSGTGGSAGCVGTIDIAVDNGALQHWSSNCASGWDPSATSAIGYAFAGGPVGAPHGIQIVGCKSAAAQSEGIQFRVLDAQGPGTYTMGSTQYTDTTGVTWGFDTDPFKVTLTKVESTGGVIEGTFSEFVTHGGSAAHSIAGSFHVCHVMDLLAP